MPVADPGRPGDAQQLLLSFYLPSLHALVSPAWCPHALMRSDSEAFGHISELVLRGLPFSCLYFNSKI